MISIRPVTSSSSMSCRSPRSRRWTRTCCASGTGNLAARQPPPSTPDHCGPTLRGGTSRFWAACRHRRLSREALVVRLQAEGQCLPDDQRPSSRADPSAVGLMCHASSFLPTFIAMHLPPHPPYTGHGSESSSHELLSLLPTFTVLHLPSVLAVLVVIAVVR